MNKVEHLMSPIDLKGQCGPLDLRFLLEIFWRDRKRLRESKSFSLLSFLGGEEELKRAKEGQERLRV